ncbi:hypothetical protein SAMN05216233_13220 [Desulfoluna spongiiphila]|uniref:Uncharacterized protein n=1 Tax=Desulfoluna spongiiphila TaxID=419481 RepID=A0A1G5JJ32_9BACT|nr:hypothetical protein SAMN05216233_13220 [Desulfoluna spongiiphila]VVS92760.1 hypothetical protein DBB_23280 [Desulfoluna spongiiphila]
MVPGSDKGGSDSIRENESHLPVIPYKIACTHNVVKKTGACMLLLDFVFSALLY